ncbi:MAG: 16S rRNA (guanine(527)-N(7))-methyltransferase RsmG [Thermodesulfobacteriota bacterium]
MTIQSSEDSADLRDMLASGARQLGIDLGGQECDCFITCLKELVEWNRKINLTAIGDGKDIVTRHFLDSLAVNMFLDGTASLLDIGSGAGFPGIPLKIVRPALDVVLLDGVGKKVAFMRHIIRTLGLKGIEAVHGRVEDSAVIAQYRGGFDVVVSRAFARLSDFLTLASPYTREGGLIIAVKGPKGDDELEGGKAAPRNLRLEKMEEVTIPFTGVASHYFIFRKEGADRT